MVKMFIDPKERKKLQPDEISLEERVLQVKRVTKVTKGGKRIRFTALVVVGDKKGHVGIGLGKAREVPDAIKKGIEKAKKNMIKVPLEEGRTIPYEVMAKFSASNVLLKPAVPGHGITAGIVVRTIAELAGIKDLTSKVIGSSTAINVAQATMKALSLLKSPAEIAKIRGIPEAELRRRANLKVS